MADSRLQQKQMLLGDDGELVVPRSRDELETIPGTVASESPSRASRNLWIVFALLASWVGSGALVILGLQGQRVENYILAYLILGGFTIYAGRIIVAVYNAFQGDHIGDDRRVDVYWASVKSALGTIPRGLWAVSVAMFTVMGDQSSWYRPPRRWW